MKFIFLIALLANILFFLWEFNSSGLHSEPSNMTEDVSKPKQIFLLSEIVDQAEKNKQTHKETESENISPIVLAKLKTSDNTISESETIKHVVPDDSIKPSVIVDSTENAGVLDVQNKMPGFIEEQQSKAILETVNVEKKDKTLVLDSPEQPAKMHCYQMGPFQNQKKLNQWLAENKELINSSQQTENKIKKKQRYLVYYPAAKTYEKSEENIQIFKRMGINEVWLFREGKLKGSISFGLFSKERSALNLKNKLSDKGLSVEILHSFKTITFLYAQVLTEKKKDLFSVNRKQVLTVCK